MGEASGEHEQRQEEPFVSFAPAGSLLERSLRRMGMDRQQFSITNILRCRPRNNWLEGAPWEYAAINHCRENLDQVIAERRPRCIVALGGTALRELTGMAGEARGISHLAGYVLPGPRITENIKQSQYEISGEMRYVPVIGDYHPAFLRRGKASHQGIFARILNRAVNIAAGKDRDWCWGINPSDESTWGGLKYRLHPSLDEAHAFRNWVCDNPNAVVAEDLETSESASLDEDAREGFVDTHIRLAQFTVAKGTGIAFPWEGEFISLAADIFNSVNPKYGHNWNLFDHKVARAAALRDGWTYAPRGPIFDTLDMFHHWQADLPAHLQFASQFISFPFPWKHLAGTNIEFYGVCDTDSDWRLGEFLSSILRKDDLWGNDTIGYLGQVFSVRPVLAGMEDRGMPIDDSARLALDAEFTIAQSALGTELAALAPDACKRLHPKKVGYVGVPPEVKKWDAEHLDESVTTHRFTEPGADGEGESYHYALREFRVPDVDAATGEPVAIATTRWCRVYEFNPNSKNQVIEYMRAKGHKVPKSKEEDDEGNQKDTTAEKELRRLAVRTGDQFYLKVVEYRGFTKLRSTYIDGFAPGADGCVHTTFTFAPAIGQLSSRNPNIQNFTKLKPTVALAKAMRKMVAARPSHVLTEWDFKSCHIITLGFLAEDLNYMRLGRLDMHSFVAGHFLKLWDGFKIFNESDDELRARFKWLKSDPDRKRVRDDQAKHGILGIGNGLRAKGLYERYMESFPPTACLDCRGTGREQGARGLRNCKVCVGTGRQSGQRTAEAVLEVAEALFPKVFTYQEAQRKEAHERQLLTTPFGYARRFYEVYRWDYRKGAWGHGDQAEEAVAYRLANIAFGHIREKLKELHRLGLDQKYGLFNCVHDSFVWQLPESMLEEHIAEVYPVLTSPSTVLKHPTICPNGLVIDVEGSYGKNWADMREIMVQSHATTTATAPQEAPCDTIDATAT